MRLPGRQIPDDDRAITAGSQALAIRLYLAALAAPSGKS
jgi:hypothetical protein